jgi:hypothetical protein
MAKQYTKAEWARLQSRLPEEDRVPYSESPDRFLTSTDYAARTERFAEVIEPGVTPDMFPSTITGVTASVPGTFNAGIGFGTATLPPTLVPTLNPTMNNVTKTIVSTYTDPNTGDVVAVWSDGSTTILAAGGKKGKASESAWNLLKGYLDTYGLGVLANDVKGYIESGLSYDELLLKLRTESKAYAKRFSANTGRISKGLRALSEAEYIKLEDDYQDIMRRYGMPDTYYAETVDPETGIKVQKGFEKFIEGDVSPIELEDRIQTAYNRVIKAAPEVLDAIKEFYGDSITNGDILSYALDTKNAIENIKRKVGAAEIGAEAMQSGLTTSMARAEELQRFGITQARAEQGFQAIADILPSATKLSQIYAKQGLGEYNQAVAEQEAFGIPGSAEAGRKRRKLTELEQAQFAGSSGAAQGALARERAGSF